MATEGAPDPRQGWLERLLVGKHRSAFEIVAPDDYASYFRGALFRWLLIVGGGCLAAVIIVGPNMPAFEFWWVFGGVSGMLGLGALLLVSPRTPPRAYAYLMIGLSPLLPGVLWFAGPAFESAIAILPSAGAAALLLYRRRTAMFVMVFGLLSYAALVFFDEGHPRPVARMVLIGSLTLAAADLFGRFAITMKKVADREHDAHERVEVVSAQLATANAELESRVNEQVEEIDRLGRLRRSCHRRLPTACCPRAPMRYSPRTAGRSR